MKDVKLRILKLAGAGASLIALAGCGGSAGGFF